MGRKLLVDIRQLTAPQCEAIRTAARANGFEAVFRNEGDALTDAEIYFGADPAILSAAPGLRWMCVPSAGVDGYTALVEAREGVILSNSSGAYGVTIAEHVVMLTLELMRRQMDYQTLMKRRDWVRDLAVRSIRGSRITLLGTGDLGREIARRYRAFAPASILGVNRRGAAESGIFDAVQTMEELEQWLALAGEDPALDDELRAGIEKVENNVREFENTCSQMVVFLKTFPDKGNVTYDDVEEFLSHTREESEFTLFAFIARGKLESALVCLHTLLRTKEAAGIGSMCASRLSSYFRRALSVQINVSNGCGISLRYGEDNTAFSRKVFEGDRPISMPKDREIYRDCCSTYTQRDMERILVTLAEYDIKIKETPVALQSIMLERCIMDIICRKGRHGKALEFARTGIELS